MSDDWKAHLNKLITDHDQAQPHGDLSTWRRELRSFIDTKVLPAYQALETELVKHEREVTIDRGPFEAVISVFHDGREEFSYAIRGRAYHRMSVAFPMLTADEEPRMLTAEIEEGGEKHRYRLDEFTVDGIIWDFLDAYKKWMGW